MRCFGLILAKSAKIETVNAYNYLMKGVEEAKGRKSVTFLETLSSGVKKMLSKEDLSPEPDTKCTETTFCDSDSDPSKPIDHFDSVIEFSHAIVREEEAEDAPSSESFYTADDSEQENPPEPEKRSVAKAFSIRNINTGEELDLRDENKTDFSDRFAKLLGREKEGEYLSAF